MTDAPLTNDRQRTYTWADTAPALAALRTLSGLEFLRAIARGDLPPSPVGMTLGMEPLREEDFTEGRAVFRLKPQEFHYNPIGSVHGGVFATLLDSALACAIHTTLPAGVGYLTSFSFKPHAGECRPRRLKSVPFLFPAQKAAPSRQISS
ncbi:PaaI family thioesterase [Deinococcus sp. UR1]|uniref:PaaI family thioesterase n=1 Tax=Deinococcus sp. UR1 TaxID=1704277 RepID=UPI0018EAABDD|nr:PaaI family thioesterase [Deinococcus sp. UR1]